MRLGILLLLLFTQVGVLRASEPWVMYARNYDNPHLKESVENFANLSTEEYGAYNIVASQDMEQGRAFAELLKGNIDIFIGAPTIKREQLASLIYVPMDRGLLGFRICLIHNDSENFKNITSPAQFINKNLSVGLSTHWPDRKVYESNGFTTVTSPVHESLYTMLHNKRFDCLTRSVNEIDMDIKNYPQLNLKSEDNLVFIYPNADFIYINSNNAALFERLSKGVQASIANKSFFGLFNKYYADDLQSKEVFERKLIFLSNQNISNEAMLAINKYGVASFLTNTLQREPLSVSAK